MVLLVETTNAEYYKALQQESEIIVPAIVGSEIFNFLNYIYSSYQDFFPDRIIFINSKYQKNHKIFEEGFSKFSPFIQDYSLEVLSNYDLIDYFPAEATPKNSYVTNEITRKVQEIESITVENESDLEDKLDRTNDYLCYLPLIENSIQKLLSNFKAYNLKVFSDGLVMKDKKSIDYTEIKREKYVEVLKELEQRRKEYYEIKMNPVEAKFYRPPKFLENFEGSYYDNINSIIEENIKKLYFMGSDNYSATRGINHLLKDRIPNHYDLRKAAIPFEKVEPPVVFSNIHLLPNSKDLKKLNEVVDEEEEDEYIILQGLKRELNYFFNTFEPLDVPDSSVIKKLATSLFISLSIEKRKYKGKFHKLYPIISSQLFNNLLNKIEEANELDSLVNELDTFDIKDLLDNPSFWYSISEKIDKIKGIKEEETPQKYPVMFRKRNKSWEFSLPNGGSGTLNDSRSLRYLILILRYYEIYQEGISVIDLRQALIKYAYEETESDKEIEEFFNIDIIDRQKRARDSCQKAIKKFLEKNSSLKDFYNKYIKFENYGYTIPKGYELEITIDDPELDDSIFNA